MSTFKINKGVVDNLESSLSGKSSTDLDNLSQTGEAHFANSALSNSPYTTNRILEIPQDIKLELVDGTLTLKAGSKVYVPNGFEEDGTTPKFDAVIIESDTILIPNWTYSGAGIVYYTTTGGTQNFAPLERCSSGSTAPTETNTRIWYDTTSNKIKRYYNGSLDVSDISLPLGIVTRDGDSYSSIDQVFNGFGYIGSTVFALPGVKVQIPDGRNEDGSCKNRPYTVTSVKTFQTNSGWGESVLHGYIGDFTEYGGSQYDFFPTKDRVTKPSEKNLYFDTVTGRYNSWCPVVSFCHDSTGKITSFTPFTVDSVANSNASNFSQAGRSYLSGIGMPSDRYIDLALGASGADYTAPVNGYVSLQMKSSSASQSFCSLTNMTAGTMVVRCFAYAANAPLRVILPIRKGDIFEPTYSNATGTLFRFVYAEGETDV